MIPLIDLKKEYLELKKEIDTSILNVLKSGNFILGKEGKKFEENFARFCGSKYCAGTNSGTSALFLALKSSGIKKGDEVITTSFSFGGTLSTILSTGAKPKLVDIKEDTFNIDENLIEENITSKTKAIIPVHIFGNPCNMDKIREIAQNHNLKIIEDSCQAHGTKYKEVKAGNLGDIGCFSFYPTKNIGAFGDAGCITTNDPKIENSFKILRNQGESSKYIHKKIGYNSRLDEIQAAVLNVKLNYIDKWTEKRRRFAKIYQKELSFTAQKTEENGFHSYHQFTIKIKDRDSFMEKLEEKGISAAIHYPKSLHEQPAYKKYSNLLPNSEKLSKEVISLPIHHSLEEEQINKVVEIINMLI